MIPGTAYLSPEDKRPEAASPNHKSKIINHKSEPFPLLWPRIGGRIPANPRVTTGLGSRGGWDVFPLFLAATRGFSLDFCMNQIDNYSVITIDLIYSPSDTPKGLWRGFVFIDRDERESHAR